eukprot:CAMPEP_0114232842 /NCGR_PEP_ID=MMETSP0058-20121206/4833_1 /TAXON_ID=36894 /ORGANISM="Pyramimonas parkeae, CCMP726" /LENGTH=424 /DNA_ID=CAMNT_0001344365 /DNA_START=177 /DNA_END=1448 /DNA_ORIENTATION=+
MTPSFNHDDLSRIPAEHMMGTMHRDWSQNSNGLTPARRIERESNEAARLKEDGARASNGASQGWDWCGGAPDWLVPFKRQNGNQSQLLKIGTGARIKRAGLRDGEALVGRRVLSAQRGPTVHGREHNRVVGNFTWMNFVKTACSNIPMGPVRVRSESHSPDPKVPYSVRKLEQPLVACLKNIRACDRAALAAALELDSVQRHLRSLPRTLLAVDGNGKTVDLAADQRYRTCAVVGNAGHLRLAKYGSYIDQHDLVLRFNAQTVRGFSEHVGSKTSMRILNRAEGAKACCSSAAQDRGLLGAETNALLLWHPAHASHIMRNCAARHPATPTYALAAPTIQRMVELAKALRRDLLRLGFGPFSNWRQLTSGGHGILAMLAVCERISIYGFTTYPQSTQGGDQYAGNRVKMGSGWTWHDWLGEQHMW